MKVRQFFSSLVHYTLLPDKPIHTGFMMNHHTLCHIDDIAEGQSKGFTLPDNDTVFAVKKDGQLVVYKNSCPHLGIELEWLEDQFLDSEGALIQCSTHGALFIIETGECVAGPCLGKALQAIPFHIDNNAIVVTY